MNPPPPSPAARDRATPPSDSVTITPPLEPDDIDFVAAFSRTGAPVARHDPRHAGHAGVPRISRIWPGQPSVPSPWAPCHDGCCLVLVGRPPDAAPQWLRFLVAEFLGRHRLDGQLTLPGWPGRPGVLLIVEASDVFEGDLAEQEWSG